jgi:hypothetical protein
VQIRFVAAHVHSPDNRESDSSIWNVIRAETCPWACFHDPRWRPWPHRDLCGDSRPFPTNIDIFDVVEDTF